MSVRQREVYELKRQGWLNPRIAFSLGIAVGTVAQHAFRAYRKAGTDETARRDAVQSGTRNAFGIETRHLRIPPPNPLLHEHGNYGFGDGMCDECRGPKLMASRKTATYDGGFGHYA